MHSAAVLQPVIAAKGAVAFWPADLQLPRKEAEREPSKQLALVNIAVSDRQSREAEAPFSTTQGQVWAPQSKRALRSAMRALSLPVSRWDQSWLRGVHRSAAIRHLDRLTD